MANNDTNDNWNDGTQLPVLGQADRSPQSAAMPAAVAGPVPTVSFVSLGCAKNLVDSERMLGQLAEAGTLISGDEQLADTIVVNTCGFLESSRTEALDILEELAERKRAGGLKRIVVAGCLVQRDGEKLRECVPEIDALVGVNNRDDVVRAVWRMDRDAQTELFLGEYHGQPWHDQGRLRLTPNHYAYLRISEGCNQKCTFCTIPSIRGPMHSKSADAIVAEARELTADGAREIILIGQDTTSYGFDLVGADGAIPREGAFPLADLLRRLDRDVIDARWIRLMYVYPSILSDEIIDALAASERIVKYIDIPLQHINDRMLKRMARRVTRRQTEELLEKLRKRIPDVAIRTTFIVGFPGETEAEFDELLSFVSEFGFEAAGAFQYSLEPETPAGRMVEQVDPVVRQERYDRFMLAQQQVAFAAAERYVGREFEVLIEGPAEGGQVARHAGQAPEVDAVCLLPDAEFPVGTFVPVRCVATQDYDLVCTPTPSA